MSSDDVVEINADARPTGRRRQIAGVAAVVVALAVGGGVSAWAATRGGGPTGAAAAVSVACPASVPDSQSPDSALGSAVPPTNPTASGVDGRLVPARAPESVAVCEYGSTSGGVVVRGSEPVIPVPASPPVSTLARSIQVGGTDDRAAPLLTALQSATIETADGYMSCGGYTPGPDDDLTYLVGLAYDDGVVWVASPGVCLGLTNGVALSAVDVRSTLAATLDGDDPVSVAPAPPDGSMPSPASSYPTPDATAVTGAPGTGTGGTGAGGTGAADSGPADGSVAPADDPLAACSGPGGSAAELVAFAPTAVRICHVPVDPGDAPSVTDQPAAVATDLAAMLAALPTSEPDLACTDIGGEVWALLFSGADGVSTRVLVDAGSCGTASNGVRTVKADAGVYARLAALD